MVHCAAPRPVNYFVAGRIRPFETEYNLHSHCFNFTGFLRATDLAGSGVRQTCGFRRGIHADRRLAPQMPIPPRRLGTSTSIHWAGIGLVIYWGCPTLWLCPADARDDAEVLAGFGSESPPPRARRLLLLVRNLFHMLLGITHRSR